MFSFLFYGNSIKNGYSMDDNYVTVTTPEAPNNPRIAKGIKGIPKIFSSHYILNEKQSSDYRPVTLTTFAIEYQFFGSNPHISHFINILLYALTGVVIYLTLILLLKDYTIYIPIAIVLLFVAHPIHSEVVNNIKCRDELLSFLFGMLSMYNVVKFIEFKKTQNILAAIVLLALSLLSKKTGVLFIPFIPITIYFFYKIKLNKLVYLTLLTCISFLVFTLIKKSMLPSHSSVRDFVFFENPLEYDHSILSRISLSLYSIGYYIRLLIIPYPLCCYYGYNTIPLNDWTSPIIIFAMLFYGFVLFYVIKNIKSKSILSYAGLIYLLGIFPFSNLLENAPGIIAERFVYFSSFGFCIAVILLAFNFFNINQKSQDQNLAQFPTKVKLVFLTVIVTFFYLAILRNPKWKDETTLLKNDVKVFPNSCNLHYMLGKIYFDGYFNNKMGISNENDKSQSVYHYSEAAKLMKEGVLNYPNDIVNKNNLGAIYVNVLNVPNLALPLFDSVLLKKPDYKEAKFNKAFCLEKLNMLDSAIYYYEIILKEKPVDLISYFRLKDLYFKKKEYFLAIKNSENALNDYPNEFKIYIDLGNSYMLLSDTLNALKYYYNALKCDSTNLNLKNSISKISNSYVK